MKDVGHSRTLENDQTEEDVIPWDSQARPRDQGDCLNPVVWAPTVHYDGTVNGSGSVTSVRELT
jgi:hypothetical protein